jgi:hypothetical protein
MAYFYAHLIEIETIIVHLNEMDLADHHKEHLAALIDSSIHHTVLDVILSRLSVEDRELFLEKLYKNPEDQQLMEFLEIRSKSIEEDIKYAVNELKKELHQDIQEAKEK